MRITIGVPFYNVADTLLDCVRSIFAQTEQDWELLLVDDGSTDESLAIARSIDDPRVRVLNDGCNRGLSARLNQIAELAKGEFVARQDADDLMHFLRLAEQAALLENHPQLDAVCSPWFAINRESDVIGHSGRCLDRQPESLLRRVPFSHGTMLCRREWLQRIPYDCNLRRSQDRDFWIRAILFEQSQVELLEEPRYFYRVPESIVLSKTLDSYRVSRQLLRKYGQTQLGRGRTAACICGSYAKSTLCQIAAPLQADKWLARKRYSPLGQREKSLAQAVLEQIRMQPIPITSFAPVTSPIA